MRPRYLLAVVLGALLGTAACWGLVHADIAVSARYYQADSGFYLDDALWVQAVYRGVPWLARGAAFAVLLTLFVSLIARGGDARRLRGPMCFLLASAAIGPGLIIHGVLKDHWGRPRPVQIIQFGGTEHYEPPGVPSAQHGHSFPSGHAAAGFYLMGLGWAFPRRRGLWWTLGIIAGLGIGYVRIVQGGHFLSDVLFAGLVVWLTDLWLAAWMRRRGWLPLSSTR